MARIKRTFTVVNPPTDQPSHQNLPESSSFNPNPSNQPPAKHTKTTARNPAYFKEPVLPTFDFTDRIASLPSPIQRAIVMGNLGLPPKHGREHDWDEWLKTTAHICTDNDRPPSREDTPPASRPKKPRQNKTEDFEEKIKEHNKKKLQNSWESVRVIEGIMKFDNPHSEGMTVIPISVHRHQSILDCEPRDYIDGEKLMYTTSWATREPRILEGRLQVHKPRQIIGEIHPMIFLTPFHSPHNLFPTYFYETIRQRFRDRDQLWGTRGLLTSRRYYSEWAEAILKKHASTLARIGLYDAIELTSQYFYKEPTVIKGFLEYWSPTTNSFHLPYGEMSITLWDLH